jgi:glycine dehydrogenase subunit 1
LFVVPAPTYPGPAAAGSAALMACRLTGRREILVPDTLSPDRLSQMRGFTRAAARLRSIGHDPATGLLDLADLRAALSADTAAVYIETPGYLGTIETQAAEIVAAAQTSGALAVVGVDPIALGVLAAPGDYGADIVVGDLQPLGIHMTGGGGLAGFIATRDEARVVAELPTYLISMVPGAEGGGFGFDVSTMERTSYDKRAAATDYYGTTQWLWGIIAGVYLALMGPRGMAELGEGIMQRAQYAARRLGAIAGVTAPALGGPFFKEFVVNFAGTGKSAEAVNRALLAAGIFGGLPLRAAFPALGESALYCVTEMHSQDDIDRLAAAVAEAVR